MPSNDALDRLTSLAKVAAQRPAWQGFATYLALRSQGRRAEALRASDAFLDEAEHWPFAQRLPLLLWLGQEGADGVFGSLLMPQPLWQRVVAPTASEWLAREPGNARANYLYAIFVANARGEDPLTYVRKAVRLDPGDQAVRKRFIHWVISHAENAQHELPWHGYLGAAAEDIHDLRDAIAMLDGIDHPAVRQELEAELKELLDVAMAWDAFQHEGSGDFASWCVAHGGPASMFD